MSMEEKISRIGVMGGTFNPIHYGHLVTAEEALSQFKLDKVMFMPAGVPPHKSDREILLPEERYLLTVIATASNPDFVVSRLEIERKGPSYTIDTLAQLQQIFGPDTTVFFITGADAVWEILTWKNAEELVELTEFIAATRPGYSLEKFKKLHVLPEGEGREPGRPRVSIMEIPALAISSTDIRRRVREDQPIRYLVPEGVASYIKKSAFWKD
ncbi:MAG: nicotinate-nucleotide adenylyltransferase [Actinobacteria bacterium]|nr:nicotinate-nucleotide adenylyltransferase [Actinomycetota bacterium]